MGQWRGLPALQRGGRGHRRRLPLGEIDFLLREIVEGRGWNAEVFGQGVFVHQTDPVADAERAELGEVAVVENEEEMAGLVAERFDDVAVATREIPEVAGTEIVGLRMAGRIDHRGADQSFGDKPPLRRRGVPMQFAHHAGLQPHGNAGDAFRNRQLRDGRLLAIAAAVDATFGFLQLEFESRQLAAGRNGIRNVVLERAAASFGADGIGRDEHGALNRAGTPDWGNLERKLRANRRRDPLTNLRPCTNI